MKQLLTAVALFLTLILPVQADELALKEGHPQTYIVKKGDTLWDISSMYLDDPWLWPELWHFNPQVENPHLIYPGDELNLVWVDGKPRLVKNTIRKSGSNRDVKLTPQMRISDLNEAIPAISLDVIGPFLSNTRIVEPGELEKAPYVLSGREGHVVTGAGDTLYARGDFADEKSYGIYRKAETFVDPQTGEFLGVQARAIGGGKRISLEKDIATLQINRSQEEIRNGDRLLPQEERGLKPRFEPRSPGDNVNGEILSVEGGVSHLGAMDVVVINRGEREGLQAGDVMAVFKKGEVFRDDIANEYVKVPDERAGMLMVFRSYEKLSLAVVLTASQALAVGDRVSNP